MMRTMMGLKCKKHPYEQGVGVCASCLRERLLELIAAQSGRPQQLQRQHSSSGAVAPPQQLPPPLVFPRSVSPYVSRRRSVDLDFPGEGEAASGSHRGQRPRFFSTPQVGPGAGRWKAAARGGFLASLFGGGHHSRSVETEPEFVDSGASHRRSSWLSAILPGRRKKKQQQKKKSSRFFDAAAAAEEEEEEDDGARRRAWRRDRHYGGGEEDSASESGYSTESSGGWRIAAPTPMRKHASSSHKTMSGFVVCLSPLVRASPRRSQAGEGAAVGGISGELRIARGSSLPRHHHHRHGSGGGGPAALVPNRSRKLADLGRFR